MLYLVRGWCQDGNTRIGKCQNPIFAHFRRNWKVSELESFRIGKCQNWKGQNWKVSESESVRIGKCQNYLEFKDSLKWDKYCSSSNLSVCHVPIEVSNATICITMVTQASFAPYLKNLKILTLSNPDTFQFWQFPILTLSTFQGKNAFWHFPILSLSSLSSRTVPEVKHLELNQFSVGSWEKLSGECRAIMV